SMSWHGPLYAGPAGSRAAVRFRERRVRHRHIAGEVRADLLPWRVSQAEDERMTSAAVPSTPELEEIERCIRAFAVEVLLEGNFQGDDPLSDTAFDSLALEQLLDHLEE